MLVLSRKLGQRFRIGRDVQITIVKIDRNSIRIGVEAPSGLKIYREEIATNEESASATDAQPCRASAA